MLLISRKTPLKLGLLFPHAVTVISMDLLQVSLAGKMGEGIKARETCNTWRLGSLAGQNSVQSASFYKRPISNHMLRRDNDTTERGSAMFFYNGRLKLR